MPDVLRPPAGRDDHDRQLRQIAHALVAEAPEVPALAELLAPAGRAAGADAADRARRWATSGVTGSPKRVARRRTVVAVAVAATVLAVVATVALLDGGGRDDADRPPSVVADDGEADPTPVPQHLVVGNGTREVLPDGQVVELERAGVQPPDAPRFRPGGGHALMATDLAGEPGDDFDPDDIEITSRLVVVGPDGAVEVERDMVHSSLVAATDTEAILTRRLVDGEYDMMGPEKLLVHDLATGEERPIAEGVTFDFQRWLPTMTTVVGDRLYAIEAPIGSGADGPCVLRVVDLLTSEDTSHTLDLDCAVPVIDPHVSPDGTRVVFGYLDTFSLGSFRSDEVHLAVVDVADGIVDHHEVIAGEGSVDGVAWKDDTTLRLATGPDAIGVTDGVTVREIPVPAAD